MPTDHVVWQSRPQLEAPTLVVAFAGWNDAGDAATWAVRHLHGRLEAEEFAHIEAEEFFDFGETRPNIEIDDGVRVVSWPKNSFSAAMNHNVLLLEGVEPHLRWRTFAEQVVDVARECGAGMIITLGALLAEVPHTRPVMVYGSCENEAVGERLGLTKSSYEGPTGIVGILNSMTEAEGIATASLWAAVPNYVSGAASPKAALALIERLRELLSEPIPSTDLEIATSAYERQITELISEDDDATDYIETLERQYDAGELNDTDPSTFVEEVEQFLRDHRS